MHSTSEQTQCRHVPNAAAFLFFSLLLTNPQQLFAHGSVTGVRGHDLQITIDTTWAGNAHGGYYPVRLRVINRGPSRVLTFQLRSQHNPMPTVRRSVSVDQNATARFTLSVPMVGEAAYAELSIFEDGGVLPGLTQHLNFPDIAYDNGRPALLLISPTNVNCDYFEDAVNSLAAMASSGRHTYWGGSLTSDHEIVSPDMLPDSWIDYSGIDIVAVTMQTLNELPQQNRMAIVKWVHTGGTLVVSEVGEPARSSRPLRDLIGYGKHAFASAEWKGSDLTKRGAITIVQTDEYGNIQEADAGETENGDTKKDDAKKDEQISYQWPATSEAFTRIDLMNGVVFAFQDNPFPGSPHDWAWFLNSLGNERFQWTVRHGVAPRSDNSEFLQFLIPGITGVPVYAFLVLITIFTIVIGPLNYVMLSRRKSLYLLLLTIPAVALATSVSLFAYSVVAHGFSIKSRVRSLTILDQKSQTAVSTNRIALYAGLAPSDGLRFGAETAVYPIWPRSTGFESGTVDWTESQSLGSGWLRSRTRTQFLTVSHRVERGRLEVGIPANGQLAVSNGLEWNLQTLVLADIDGNLFAGSDISAGASTKLLPADAVQLNAVVQLIKEFPVRTPQGFEGSESVDVFSAFNSRWWSSNTGNVKFANSQMERELASLTQLTKDRRRLPKNSYVAVLSQNPGVELGVEETNARATVYVLVGYY